MNGISTDDYEECENCGMPLNDCCCGSDDEDEPLSEQDLTDD